MEPRDFCYWLQGFFEMTDVDNLSKEQIEMIQDHLKTVFEKITQNGTAPTGLPDISYC